MIIYRLHFTGLMLTDRKFSLELNNISLCSECPDIQMNGGLKSDTENLLFAWFSLKVSRIKTVTLFIYLNIANTMFPLQKLLSTYLTSSYPALHPSVWSPWTTEWCLPSLRILPLHEPTVTFKRPHCHIFCSRAISSASLSICPKFLESLKSGYINANLQHCQTQYGSTGQREGL